MLFIFWPLHWKLSEHTCTFFFSHTAVHCSGILNNNIGVLARKFTVFSCLCHWATRLEQLLKGSSTEADERGQSVFHSVSVLSEDWDPADQSHKQITINKLNGESQRLGVLENNDERQVFKKKKEKTLNKKQEPINCTNQPSALQIYSRLRRPLFTESVYHTCALLSTGEMLHVSQ